LFKEYQFFVTFFFFGFPLFDFLSCLGETPPIDGG